MFSAHSKEGMQQPGTAVVVVVTKLLHILFSFSLEAFRRRLCPFKCKFAAEFVLCLLFFSWCQKQEASL